MLATVEKPFTERKKEVTVRKENGCFVMGQHPSPYLPPPAPLHVW
jgi:hypothetical protein